MLQSQLVLLFLSLVSRVDNVNITALWVPDTFQGNLPFCRHSDTVSLTEGSRTSMVVDCVYNYTLADRDSLEIKWYFKQVGESTNILSYSSIHILNLQGLEPVYQWIPPNPPQIISPLFQRHLVPNFEVTSDPFTKFRALNLGNVTTELSGLYSCR